jgi:hypothetical protein
MSTRQPREPSPWICRPLCPAVTSRSIPAPPPPSAATVPGPPPMEFPARPPTSTTTTAACPMASNGSSAATPTPTPTPTALPRCPVPMLPRSSRGQKARPPPALMAPTTRSGFPPLAASVIHGRMCLWAMSRAMATTWTTTSTARPPEPANSPASRSPVQEAKPGLQLLQNWSCKPTTIRCWRPQSHPPFV